MKEKNLPDLCADRIDYSLRSAMAFREIQSAQYFIEHLSVQNDQWIFIDLDSAEKFAELFLHINTEYYSGIFSAVMFRTVGDYLRHAIQKKYISKTDLYTTDKQVLQK
ncbi:MAG: hypothetical protein A2378_02380 [Candidatus Pacebacteria bacterium RIFOXYB1_FULL_44_10]|nr:MAG: hypothetical protein A2378_02380 [Candidatus Pacebacteria bacterium RIFOXYB1_FULL_44_10]